MEENSRGKDISMSQRQIYILSLLSENPRGYQADEIRSRLMEWNINVSRRTILRDIDELSLNYGISEETRGGRTYFYADKYTLKNVDLTIEDMAALAFTREILKEYSQLEMGKHASALIDKVVEGSASLNRLQFEKLCRIFKQEGHGGNRDIVDWKTEKIIQNAIDNRNKIEIGYYSFSSDESTKRKLHPYRMIIIDSYLCVEGFCELRKEIRRFRVSRIHSIEMLDEHYTEDMPEKDDDAFIKLAGNEPEDIELVFTGQSIRYVKEYEAERAKRLENKEDGLHFYQRAAVAPDVIRWIRGFGSEVKVISPEWLSKQILEESVRLLEVYDNP